MYLNKRQLKQDEVQAGIPTPASTPATPATNSEPSMFGITTETVGSSYVPLTPTEQNPFPIVDLKEVRVVERLSKGVNKQLLEFVFFEHFDGIKSQTQTEWEIGANDGDANKRASKANAMNVRIKHIYEQFATLPATGLGIGAKTWKEYFTMIADAFNKGDNGNPIYTGKPCWAKVVINAGYEDKGFQFPYSAPFLERVAKDTNGQLIKPKSLVINISKGETIIQSMSAAKVGNAPTGGAAPAGGAWPSFPGM